MDEKRNDKPGRGAKPNRREDRKRDFSRREREDTPENMLEGRNAVTEALSAGRTIDKLFVADGDTDRALARICAMAKEAGAVVVPTDRRKLDFMSATGAHQGVIAMVAAHDYASIDDILKKAADAGEAPLIVICDELSDPHNLGAIIRTAECAGAHGVIIPKRRSVGLTAVVGKASAGALEYLPVARVSNITAAIDTLKKAGVWIYGTAAEGSTTLYKADLKGAAAIVIGNEGQGMSRLVSDSCDFKVSIPMKGSICICRSSDYAVRGGAAEKRITGAAHEEAIAGSDERTTAYRRCCGCAGRIFPRGYHE